MKTHVLILAALCGCPFLMSGCFHAGFETLSKKTPCGEMSNKGVYLELFGRPAPHDLPCPGEQPRPMAQVAPSLPPVAAAPEAAPEGYVQEAPQYDAGSAQIVVPAAAAYSYCAPGLYSPVYGYRWVQYGNRYVRQQYVHHYMYHAPAQACPRYYRPQTYVSSGRRYYVLPPTPTIHYARPPPHR